MRRAQSPPPLALVESHARGREAAGLFGPMRSSTPVEQRKATARAHGQA